MLFIYYLTLLTKGVLLAVDILDPAFPALADQSLLQEKVRHLVLFAFNSLLQQPLSQLLQCLPLHELKLDLEQFSPPHHFLIRLLSPYFHHSPSSLLISFNLHFCCNLPEIRQFLCLFKESSNHNFLHLLLFCFSKFMKLLQLFSIVVQNEQHLFQKQRVVSFSRLCVDLLSVCSVLGVV